MSRVEQKWGTARGGWPTVGCCSILNAQRDKRERTCVAEWSAIVAPRGPSSRPLRRRISALRTLALTTRCDMRVYWYDRQTVTPAISRIKTNLYRSCLVASTHSWTTFVIHQLDPSKPYRVRRWHKCGWTRHHWGSQPSDHKLTAGHMRAAGEHPRPPFRSQCSQNETAAD
jgi:hypothetical protein